MKKSQMTLTCRYRYECTTLFIHSINKLLQYHMWKWEIKFKQYIVMLWDHLIVSFPRLGACLLVAHKPWLFCGAMSNNWRMKNRSTIQNPNFFQILQKACESLLPMRLVIICECKVSNIFVEISHRHLQIPFFLLIWNNMR